MDAQIIALIIGAAIASLKIVKDAFDKKLNWLWVVIDAVLIYLLLGSGIFARLTQKQKETDKTDSLNAKIDRVSTHGDTSISIAENNIGKKIKDLEDTLGTLRAQNAVQKKILDFERKPVVEINSISRGQNPSIKESGKDSIQVSTELENIGNSWATHLRVRTLSLSKNTDGSFIVSDRPLWQNDVNKYEKMYPGQKYAVRTDMVIGSNVFQDSYLYFGILYRFTDSLNRPSGLLVRLFKWRLKNIRNDPELTDDNELNFFQSKMKERKLWPGKSF